MHEIDLEYGIFGSLFRSGMIGRVKSAAIYAIDNGSGWPEVCLNNNSCADCRMLRDFLARKYTVSQKKQDTKLMLINVNRFSNFFRR